MRERRKGGDRWRKRETEKDSERKWRSSGLCPGFSPRVAVLSLQQRLSVALCVAQYINMYPSRRITPASESFQTNTNAHFGQQKHLSFPFSPLPPHPLPSVSFRWLMVCAELWAYSTFMMWAKPIWDSISCLPALSTLKTTTILSRGRSSELISLFRSRPRSKSSPSPLLWEQTLLLMLFFLCLFPIYICFHVTLWEQNLPENTSEAVIMAVC